MSSQGAAAGPASALLRQWRTRRRVSQQELSSQTGISTRHLSFLETGRARPSRQMASMARPTPMDGGGHTLLAPDRIAVTVPVGTCGRRGVGSVSVEEDATQVRLTARVAGFDPPGRNDICTVELAIQQVTVELAGPLGDRQVVDTHNGRVLRRQRCPGPEGLRRAPARRPVPLNGQRASVRGTVSELRALEQRSSRSRPVRRRCAEVAGSPSTRCSSRLRCCTTACTTCRWSVCCCGCSSGTTACTARCTAACRSSCCWRWWCSGSCPCRRRRSPKPGSSTSSPSMTCSHAARCGT